MDPDVLAAIQRTECFEVYEERIPAIRAQVSAMLGAPVYLKQGSNYESSDRLVIFFDGRGRAIEGDYHRAASMVQFSVSYKDPFYTY